MFKWTFGPLQQKEKCHPLLRLQRRNFGLGRRRCVPGPAAPVAAGGGRIVVLPFGIVLGRRVCSIAALKRFSVVVVVAVIIVVFAVVAVAFAVVALVVAVAVTSVLS